MSDNRDWQADKINNLLKRCEVAKSYGETIAVSPDAIIELINQAAADKQRADIAELAYQGLQEDVVTIGEYQSLRDKYTAMTKAYRGEKYQTEYWREATRQGNIELEAAEAREKKLKEAINSAINEKAQWGDAGNALDVIVRYLSDTLSELYPTVWIRRLRHEKEM